MTQKSIEAEMELLPYQKYSQAVSICNNLAALASQCTTVIFVQRITVLKCIESCWTKGFETNVVTPKEHDAAAENGLNSPIRVNDGGIRIKLEPEYSNPMLENFTIDGGDSSDGTIVDEHLIGGVELIEEEDRGKLNAMIGEEEELGAKRSKGAVVRGQSRAKQRKTAIWKGKTKHAKKEPKDIEEPAEDCDNAVLMAKDSKSSYKFLCFSCKHVFKTSAELKEHRTLVHGHKDYESEVKKKGVSQKLVYSPNTTNGQNRCPSCNRLFCCQLLWNLHIKNHVKRHKYSLNVWLIQDDSNCAVHVKKRVSDKPFVCRRCCISFVHFSNLRCHRLFYHASRNSLASELRVCVQRKHLAFAKYREIRNFRDCRKSQFRQGGNICSRDSKSLVRTRRLRSVIDENKADSSAKYACTFCKESFQYKSALKCHLLKHSGEKPYQCNVCGKQFRRKSRYEGHIRNHTGDKPYECKECGLRFPQSGNLYYHIKTRHVTKNPLLKKDTKRKSDLKVDVQENNLKEGSRIRNQGPDDGSEIQNIETKDGMAIGVDKKDKMSDDEGVNGRKCERTFKKVSEFEGRLDDRPFSCEFCDASFRQKSILVIHRRRHTGEKPLECDECEMRFLQHSTLRYHKRTRHTTEQPCVCTYCGKEFARSILLEYHVRKHTGGRPFACLRCSETFASLTKYEEHVRQHPRDTVSDSDLTFALENFRKSQNIDTLQNSAKTKSQASNHPPDSRPFACEFCDATFRQKSILVNHRRRHTGEKPYECDECKMRFKQHSALRYHRKTRHTDDEQDPSVCTYCNKQFPKSILLEYHLRKHTGGRPFTCGLCSEMFTNLTKLEEHRKHCHAKPGSNDPNGVATSVPDSSKHLRKHTCAICERTFQSKADLQRHSSVHSSEKAFMCTDCGTCFRLKASLEAHSRRHTGEKPYHCTDCGMQFRQQSTLKYHVRAQHTREKPFLCLECGKMFRSSTMLKYHTRTHTGEKPFACEVCGSRFARPGQFRQHKKLHSSALTYACDDCGKKFRLQTTFAKHRKTHQKTSS